MKFIVMFQCTSQSALSYAGTDEAVDNSRFIEKKKGNLPQVEVRKREVKKIYSSNVRYLSHVG